MTPKRNRTNFASAGLKTALSLGVVTLVGCQSFNPNPSAPTTGGASAAPPATTTQSPAPVQPVGNPATPAPVKLSPPIRGKAAVAGKALANARIKVINSVTGAEVTGLVAAGGMNYGVLQAGLTTDANGQFQFSVPTNVNDGAPLTYEVVIGGGVGGGQAVSTLIAIANDSIAGIGGAPGAGGATEFSVGVDTTLATSSVAGLIGLGGDLTNSAFQQLVSDVVTQGNNLASTARTSLSESQQLEIANSAGTNNGRPAASVVTTVVQSNNALSSTLETAATTVINKTVELRSTPSNVMTTTRTLVTPSDLQIVQNVVTSLTITAGTGGGVAISGTGLTSNLTVESKPVAVAPTSTPATDAPPTTTPATDAPPTTTPATNAPPTTTPATDAPPTTTPGDTTTDAGEGATEENATSTLSNGVFVNSDKDGTFFSPSMSISLTGSKGLMITVSQDAGETDVGTIVARFPKANVTLTAPGGSWDNGENLGTGTTTPTGATASTNAIEYLSTATAPGVDARLDGKNYSATASQVWFKGVWKDNGTKIADVYVYDNGTDILLQMEYNFAAQNTSVSFSNRGHSTTMTTAGTVVVLTSKANANTMLTSRGNVYTSERFDELTP